MENQEKPSEFGKRTAKPKRQLDQELDRLEARMEELRVQFEQFFVDVLPHPPEKLQREVETLIKTLLKAPFRNSAVRFRLRTLVYRYQTYGTYWERVLKQREEGTYSKDLFKVELREKLNEDLEKANSRVALAERGIKQLYDTYESALKKAGSMPNNLNFDSFKKSLVKQAKQLKEKHGAKKLRYKVLVKGGKVVIKASTKND